jgi:putative membrane protein
MPKTKQSNAKLPPPGPNCILGRKTPDCGQAGKRQGVPMADRAEPSAIKPDAASKLALDRTRLSYGRTMLAWVRTAIALITFGFSIQQFFRMARPGAAEDKGLMGPHEFGMAMIIIGLLALLLAAVQHRSNLAALREQYPETEGYSKIQGSGAVLLAALIAILGMLALLAAIVRE